MENNICYIDKEQRLKLTDKVFSDTETGNKCKVIIEMLIDKLNNVYAEGYKKGYEAGQKSGDVNDG